MTTTKLFFCDMETLSLPRGAQPPIPWEVAWITAVLDGSFLTITESSTFQPRIAATHLGHADPMSLRIGGFYERYKHPLAPDVGVAHAADWEDWETMVHASSDRWWVGACPDFDEKIARIEMLKHNLTLASHYHLIDVEQYAAGRFQIPLPWNLKNVMERAGVTRSPLGAHTALGDTIDCVRLFCAAADATLTSNDLDYMERDHQ